MENTKNLTDIELAKQRLYEDFGNYVNIDNYNSGKYYLSLTNPRITDETILRVLKKKGLDASYVFQSYVMQFVDKVNSYSQDKLLRIGRLKNIPKIKRFKLIKAAFIQIDLMLYNGIFGEVAGRMQTNLGDSNFDIQTSYGYFFQEPLELLKVAGFLNDWGNNGINVCDDLDVSSLASLEYLDSKIDLLEIEIDDYIDKSNEELKEELSKKIDDEIGNGFEQNFIKYNEQAIIPEYLPIWEGRVDLSKVKAFELKDINPNSWMEMKLLDVVPPGGGIEGYYLREWFKIKKIKLQARDDIYILDKKADKSAVIKANYQYRASDDKWDINGTILGWKELQKEIIIANNSDYVMFMSQKDLENIQQKICEANDLVFLASDVKSPIAKVNLGFREDLNKIGLVVYLDVRLNGNKKSIYKNKSESVKVF